MVEVRNAAIRRSRARVTARLSAKAILSVAGALLLCTTMAGAADWPTKAVTVVVPYPPGGNTDIMARLASAKLAEKFGKPFVVENRAGASGTLGTGYVAQAAPDGHTLLFGAGTPVIIVPMLQKVAYDPAKDLVPVSIFGTGAYILGVNARLPARTLPEFIAHAKANPGKLNYGTAGPGGIIHLATALFAKRAGLDMTHIPYNGALAVNGLVTGEIDLYFGNGSELLQHADSGRIRLLATSAPRRNPQFPDLPAVAETFPGFRATSWNGFLAPAGTPPAVIDALAKAIAEAAKDPAVVERLTQLGIEPGGATPSEFAEIIANERGTYREALVAAGLKQE
jgi:tripartite-type tricarboxylate transporter receptor subunit TctC